MKLHLSIANEDFNDFEAKLKSIQYQIKNAMITKIDNSHLKVGIKSYSGLVTCLKMFTSSDQYTKLSISGDNYNLNLVDIKELLELEEVDILQTLPNTFYITKKSQGKLKEQLDFFLKSDKQSIFLRSKQFEYIDKFAKENNCFTADIINDRFILYNKSKISHYINPSLSMIEYIFSNIKPKSYVLITPEKYYSEESDYIVELCRKYNYIRSNNNGCNNIPNTFLIYNPGDENK